MFLAPAGSEDRSDVDIFLQKALDEVKSVLTFSLLIGFGQSKEVAPDRKESILLGCVWSMMRWS